LESSGETVDTVADAALTLCTEYLSMAVKDKASRFYQENPRSSLAYGEFERVVVDTLTKSARAYAVADILEARAKARRAK
jgi:hypothetical protein